MRNLVLVLLLVGCATDPQIVYKPVEVKIPVKEKCVVQIPAEPVWFGDAIPQGTSWYDKMKYALMEIEQRRDYERRLLAEAQKCN